MSGNRIARELESRATTERKKTWKRPEVLPEPTKEPGYSYRWVRVSTNGQPDARNISAKLREGYEPVRIEEQPQFEFFIDSNSRFKDNIEVQGLLLCKIPEEVVAERNAYYSSQNTAQMESVDNNFMRENDPRMPLFKEKRSTTSFGKGI